MELRQLRYFLQIVDAGGFRAAADRLSITQPSLSRQIRDLELELGTPVLLRGQGPVQLTKAGEILRKHATRLVQGVDLAATDIWQAVQTTPLSVTVGTIPPAHQHWLPQILGRFTPKYPRVTVQVRELPGPRLEEELASGHLNFGIGIVPPTRASLRGEPLHQEHLVCIAHPDVLPPATNLLTLKALAGVPLILLDSGFHIRRMINQLFKQAKCRPHVIQERNTVEGILTTLPHLPAATILPEFVLRGAAASSFQVHRITRPLPKLSIGLLWRKHDPGCPAAKALASETRHYLREQGKLSTANYNGEAE